MAVTISTSPFHVQAIVTQPYGPSSISYACGFHTGIDIVSQEADKTIYSVCSGVVVGTGYLVNALGNEVLIQGDNGYYWRYCHMVDGSIRVSNGQRVDTNTPLGTMGATGRVTGPHLHLEASTTSVWSTANCDKFVSPGPIIRNPKC